MNKKEFIKGKVKIDTAEKKITVIASDESLDRHGDVLPITNWDLTKFLGSPRMLVDHDHRVEKIVGRWNNPRIEGKQLKMDAEFHEFTDLAKAVKQMVAEGFLNTVSVGFISHGPEKDGDLGRFELIETSWVTVPANPSAVIENQLKSFDTLKATDDEVTKVKEFIEYKEGEEPTPEPEPEKIDDKTPEGMEEKGWKIIKSVEDYNEWQKSFGEAGNILNLCDNGFLKSLIDDSEKLRSLTQENGDDTSSDKQAILVEAMKQVAKTVNITLHHINKS